MRSYRTGCTLKTPTSRAIWILVPLLVFVVWWHPGAAPLRVVRAENPAARSSLPTRIILGWSGDVQRTQSVTWRTDLPLSRGVGEIAVETGGSDIDTASRAVEGNVETVDLGDGQRVGHSRVDFMNLQPDTRYAYRVGDGRTWSEWNQFRTAASRPGPFRFIYLADAQNGIRSLWPRVVRAAYAAAPDARFMVHAGDLVAEGYDDRLWGEWCDAVGFISAQIPSLPTLGSHDLHRPPGNAAGLLEAPRLWGLHFPVPSNGPDLARVRQQSYFVDYQGVRVIALDVNAFANEDYMATERDRVRASVVGWLKGVLATNANRWTIVVQHQAVYPIAKDRDYADMRAALVPLFDQYGVDLVLQGHDHAYGRTFKLARGRVVEAQASGTIYAISVAGSKMYEVTNRYRPLMAAVLANRQLYQIISVNGDTLSYRAHTVAGETIDSFEIQKTRRSSIDTGSERGERTVSSTTGSRRSRSAAR